MMEFLDKIYGYEHFGIILFSVIVALVLIFLVVLFFGKKDEKKREIERTQKLEQEKLAKAFADTTPEAVAVNVPTPEAVVEEKVAESPEVPVMESTTVSPIPALEEVVVPPIMPVEKSVEEPVIPVMPVAEVVKPIESTPVLEPIASPSIVTAPVSNVTTHVEPEIKVAEPTYTVPEAVVEPLKEEPVYDEIEIPDFNFDELAASIASELSELENKEVTVAPVKEEQDTIIPKPIINPIVTDTPITKMEDVVKPIQRPVQTFSSVYVDKPAEPIVTEPVIKEEPLKREEVIEHVKSEPVKKAVASNPNIDLPKPAEMPILKQNTNQVPNPVENPIVPDFSQFEGESYNLK